MRFAYFALSADPPADLLIDGYAFGSLSMIACTLGMPLRGFLRGIDTTVSRDRDRV